MVFGRRKSRPVSSPGPELIFDPLTTDDLLARVDAGNIAAMMELARRSYEGDGVPQDFATAAQWLLKADALNEERASFMLAHMYMSGQGVAKNGLEAMRRFRSQSTQNSFAIIGLGRAHFDGDIVPQNVVLAYACFRIAAALGNEEGTARLAMVAANISPAQLEQGDALFAAWRPGMPPPAEAHGDVTMPADSKRARAVFFSTYEAALRDLSAGDVSVLEAASQRPGSTILTVAHSRLAVFATLMERGGWALPQAVPGPMNLDGRARQYLVTEPGREGLQLVFQAMLQRQVR